MEILTDREKIEDILTRANIEWKYTLDGNIQTEAITFTFNQEGSLISID